MLGAVVLLTAPAAGLLTRAVWGAWPTVDKAGSFLFYLDGVQWRPFAAGALLDPSLKLIGIQVGHLWATALLDLFLSPHGAFNAQALLHIWLAWICAWLLLREVGARPWPAVLCAFPFALGLHVFRDVNYYTIEKSGVFGIPLFLWTLLRAGRRGGRWLALAPAVSFGIAFYNEYLALVGGALAALWLLQARTRRALLAAGLSALAAAPVFAAQALLMRDAGALGDPARFLAERAALDVLSLTPPRWYHLELWRAMDLPLVALGAAWLWRRRQHPEARWAGLAVCLLCAFSLGPRLAGDLQNPLFLTAWRLIPGFWRLARPEFLFEGAYLVLLCAAGLALSAWVARTRWLAMIGAALLAGWLAGVRTHPVWPGFSEPIEVRLDAGWERQVFGEAPR
jgi:hypothetical protein